MLIKIKNRLDIMNTYSIDYKNCNKNYKNYQELHITLQELKIHIKINVNEKHKYINLPKENHL